MHTLWLCLLPSVSVPLSTPSATMALKLPRKFNSQLEMYRARVGHTRIDDVEGNIGKRQGRRITTGSYGYTFQPICSRQRVVSLRLNNSNRSIVISHLFFLLKN